MNRAKLPKLPDGIGVGVEALSEEEIIGIGIIGDRSILKSVIKYGYCMR